MFMAYSPFCHLLSQRTLQLHPWQAYFESFSTPWGVFSLDHEPAPSLRLPYAKHPSHLGGLKQWLKEDLLNSSMPWLGLEPGTSASTV